MKKTLKQIKIFINARNEFVTRFPEKTKLEYALTKVSTRCDTILKPHNELVIKCNEDFEDIQAMNCATYLDGDKKGVQITNPDGTYKYTTEGDLKCKKEIRGVSRLFAVESEKILATEVEVEPFFVDVTPFDLSDTYLEAFDGFVFESKPDSKSNGKENKQNETQDETSKEAETEG